MIFAVSGREEVACLLQVLNLVIETGGHLDIANFNRGMRNALVVIALEAIILNLGVAADTAAIVVAASICFQVRHRKAGV